jgi:hypothetical protein
VAELKGVAAMSNQLRKLVEEFPQHVARALYVEAQIEMTEAKRRCPVAPDGGTLRASGMVHPPEIHGSLISVQLSFGGAAQDYAIAVHEHLSEHSPPSWVIAEEGYGVQWSVAGTGPKFLESTLDESREYMGARVARRVHFDKMRGY